MNSILNVEYKQAPRNPNSFPLPLGSHSVIELYDCDALLLGQVARVRETLVAAAERCKATIVEVVFHEFNPHGVSGVIIIAESHLAIHTWPEHRYAAIDLFTCGNTLNPEPAAEYLAQEFKAASCHIYKIPRGRFDVAGQPIHTPLVIRAEIKGAEEKRPFISLRRAARFLLSASFFQWLGDFFY